MSFKLFSGLTAFRKLRGDATEVPAGPNPLNLVFTGFTTDPAGDACGQRAQAEQFQAAAPGSDFLIWAWDQEGWGTDKAILECTLLLAQMRAGNASGPYTHFLSSGHSFGGCFLVFFCNWLAANASDVSLDLVRLLDPVPNSFDTTSWTLPLGAAAAVQQAMQFTQHNGMGFMLWIGPNGTPVKPASVAVDNLLASLDFPFEFWPTITHISLPADPRVWTPSFSAMMSAVGLAT